MPRRTPGTGSIQKIRDDYWRIAAPAGKDPETGKRRRIIRYVRGTKRQAEEALLDLLGQVRGDEAPNAPARYTVADLLDDWYAERSPDWAPQTRRTRAGDVKHLKAVLGHVRLRDLDALTIQRAIAKMRAQGYCAGTINGRLSALSGALARAIELGRIKHDPMRGVRRPKTERRSDRVLTEEQLIAVLREARRSRWWLAIVLAAHTGLRRGEVLGLQWRDVDWERAEIRVRRTVITGDDGRPALQDRPKTRAAMRAVAVDPYILGLLRHHRRQQAEERLHMGPEWQDHGLIFPGRDGRPVAPSTIDAVIVSVRKRLGLPWLRLHDLRHAHASHLLAAGINPADVAARLGHSRPSVTLQLYAHALPGRQHELVQRLAFGTKVAPFLEDGSAKTR